MEVDNCLFPKSVDGGFIRKFSNSGFYLDFFPSSRYVRGYRRNYEVLTSFGLSGCVLFKCIADNVTCKKCPYVI